jgi:hypothetical protein
VEFRTVNAETIFVILLSKTNVTVCGSPTVEGLSHVTLSPALTCIFLGINTVNGAVEFPPPDCTLCMASLFVASAALTFSVNTGDDVQEVAIATKALTTVMTAHNVFLFIFNKQTENY